MLNLSLSAPSAGTVVNTATLTIKDDDLAGVIAFAAPAFLVAESGGQAEITIVRSGGTAGCPSPLVGSPPSCPDATLVTFSTSDGTATVAGNDYTATTVTVEFGAGEFVKTVLVPDDGRRRHRGHRDGHPDVDQPAAGRIDAAQPDARPGQRHAEHHRDAVPHRRDQPHRGRGLADR